MRTSCLQCFTLAVCLGLALGTAQAAAKKKPVRRSGKAVVSHRAVQSKGKHARKTTKKKNWRSRGQQAMNPERVREIQSALIREKFLEGQPTGVWDQRSKEAMARYQSVNGWQSKVVPDSRALIKLGLGPDRANLINPETAAIGSIPGGGTERNSPPPTP